MHDNGIVVMPSLISSSLFDRLGSVQNFFWILLTPAGIQILQKGAANIKSCTYLYNNNKKLTYN